jgi:hypothetical protein
MKSPVGRWATLTRNYNPGLFLTWIEITGGCAPSRAFREGACRTADFTACPPAPASLDKLVSSREPDPPLPHSPNSRFATASCARVPPKTGCPTHRVLCDEWDSASRTGKDLAETLSRFQCVNGTQTNREAALHAPEPREARFGGVPGGLVCVERTLLSAAFDSCPEKSEQSKSNRGGVPARPMAVMSKSAESGFRAGSRGRLGRRGHFFPGQSDLYFRGWRVGCL